MNKIVNVAILGSTGFVGLELVRILIQHPFVNINYIGCENFDKEKFSILKKRSLNRLPKLSLNKDFDSSISDVVFLALPHGITHKYVKNIFNKNIKIIDLSGDFRLDSTKEYNKNYNNSHSCPELLKEFTYGLYEINHKKIKNSSNIAVPGCYPTSILLPLIPILKENLIKTSNIIIDSKSGYSGAGKKFDLKNIKNSEDFNFYNYNTNDHRHICEIEQELKKVSSKKIKFSFNPHVLPSYRGMMSTIYCDLKAGVIPKDIESLLINFYKKSYFINVVTEDNKVDFFKIQNTNKCMIKIFNHHSSNKIIIVSLIDNLLKGAAGQAVQCFNNLFNFEDSMSLKFKK